MKFDLEKARARLADLARPSAADLRDDLAAIARPRLSGSEGAREVEQELRRRFQSKGYEVEELAFSFSRWPGRFGLPVAAAFFAIAGGVAAWSLAAGFPIGSLIALLLGGGVALLPLVLLSRAIRGLPWGRIETANLLFTRPGSRPQWIVMAHRDSKSQLVPSLIRMIAVTAASVAWVILIVLSILWLIGDPYTFENTALLTGTVLVIAAFLLVLSWAGNSSAGALDNASGVLALLGAADAVDDRGHVAFLLTDGEELGLAGARDVVDRLPPIQGVLNVEGLDDEGEFIVAEGVGWRREGTAPQLAAALLAAGNALDLPIERRRLPRSILVDHLPVAAAGIPSLTLMRGDWGSLMRVHRPSDDTEHLRGDGAAAGAALLTATFRLLGDAEDPHLASRRRTGS